jgi:hypothetical protein
VLFVTRDAAMCDKATTASIKPNETNRVQQWLEIARAEPHIAAGLDLLIAVIIDNHRAKQRLKAEEAAADGDR